MDDVSVWSPLQGTVVALTVEPGEVVAATTTVAVVESMKMEHPVVAGADGTIGSLTVGVGDLVQVGDPLVTISPEVPVPRRRRWTMRAPTSDLATHRAVPSWPRCSSASGWPPTTLPVPMPSRSATPEAIARPARTWTTCATRGRSRSTGGSSSLPRTQSASLEELIARTPADGLIGRPGSDRRHGPCAVVSYDYMVLAGTQGQQNHAKKDRLFELIERLRLPVVLFAEGGGGRPGDTDSPVVAGLDCMAFALFARSRRAGAHRRHRSGRCFAGNAALLGCCDVIIATTDANIGMGGPGHDRGRRASERSHPRTSARSVQAPNGVVDVVVEDESEAVATAKRYLGYFADPGPADDTVGDWACADQAELRHVIPENRRRVYEVREVITGLADADSVLELRRAFGVGMVTALDPHRGSVPRRRGQQPDALGWRHRRRRRRQGRPVPAALRRLRPAGAVPLRHAGVPGGTRRRGARPRCAASAGCSSPARRSPCPSSPSSSARATAWVPRPWPAAASGAPLFTVAWPSGEFGGMGLEGAVQLGFPPRARRHRGPCRAGGRVRRSGRGRAYEHGKALNMATHFEIDDVIDPADSRRRIVNTLRSCPTPEPRTTRKHPVDPW